MAAWPSELPAAPHVDGYQERPGSETIASAMDVGPAKVRRRVTAVPRRFVVRYRRLTREQIEIFESFFHDTLLGGSLPFEWQQPRTGETVSARILSELDPPYTITPFRAGARWILEFQLEVQP